MILQIALILCSVLLLTDSLYELYNYRFYYFLDLMNRYLYRKNIPASHKLKLKLEISKHYSHVKTYYLWWFLLMLFTNVWYVPFIVFLIIFILNIFNRETFVKVEYFNFKLLLNIFQYGYVIIGILYKFVY
jgi:uncharacterized integral membrane protein